MSFVKDLSSMLVGEGVFFRNNNIEAGQFMRSMNYKWLFLVFVFQGRM
jgi:hypothetical protein